MFPVGIYEVRLGDHDVTESKTGTATVEIKFTPIRFIAKDVGDESELPFTEEKTLFIHLTEGTLGTPDDPGIAARALKAIGYTKDSLVYLDPTCPGCHSFAGNLTTLRLKHEEYQGRTREKWDVASKKTSEKLERTKLQYLDSYFRK